MNQDCPPPTLIWRHARERLSKCSLRGLEEHPLIEIYSYPREPLPDAGEALLLDVEGPPLCKRDHMCRLILLDGSWRYAKKMRSRLLEERENLSLRSLPWNLQTAYPRRQQDCTDPKRGLASIEALVAAHYLLGRPQEGLLDSYYWREDFLKLNADFFSLDPE